MGGSTTSPYVESEREPRAEIRRYHTLVMLWSADEDERVGEDAPLEGAGPWIIARDDPPSRSTPFQYQRGGVSVVTGGLTGKNVSRKLLTLDVTDMLEIRGIGGTVPVTVNREPAQIGMKLRAGDLIEIHKRYLLLVAERTSPFVRVDNYPAFPFGGPDAFKIVGESPAAWSLRARIAFVAATSRHAFLLGASGTGKELVAKATHGLSQRARGPFVARNAATMPETLMDAELFGHARNFPNAGMPEREGLIAAAHDGTLFLDEIGELPVEAQAKLLRALDEGGEFQRLGETTSHRSNFRLIAATNRARAALKFDFAARIPLQIHMPTLAERVEDIPLIARSIVLRLAHTDEFARRFVHTEGVRRTVRFTSALMADLIKRDYPNNVRELEEALWGPLEHSTGDVLDLVGPTAPPANARAAGPMTPTEVTALLTKHDWTVARAAEASGMSRYVLIRLMEKYGIQK